MGAGPAGSTAAALARKRGLTVGIAEKEAFPRFKIGESMLPNSNAILRETGAWPKLEAAGFIRKYGASFCLPDGSSEKEIIFGEGMVPGLDYTFQVERARFDAILLENARELGAQVFPRTAVKAVAPLGDAHALTLSDSQGERTVFARWILDASGRENSFCPEFKRELDPPRLAKRIAVYSHFEGVHRPPYPKGGHTIVVRLPDGWFWIIPIDEQRTSIGLVTKAENLRGREPAAVFREAVQAAPQVREWMAQAKEVGAFRVTSDYSYFRKTVATPRIVLVGDAAGFFDPIFSSGVYVAMFSAKTAVNLIANAQAEGRSLTRRECDNYGRTLKNHAGVFEKLIKAFYDNDSFAIFMSSDPPLKIDVGINSIVAGVARLPWSVWWRFKLFLIVCALQKRLHFTPPVFSEQKASA